jgi:hypothetical protein
VLRAGAIIGIVTILGIVIALGFGSYADYSPRSSVTAVLVYVGNVKTSLEEACAQGTFVTKHSLKDLGAREAELNAFVVRAELSRVSPNTVRLRTVVADIYGHPFFGLFRWKVIPQGSALEFEYSCTEARVFSARLAGSTIDPKYLPVSMRAQ